MYEQVASGSGVWEGGRTLTTAGLRPRSPTAKNFPFREKATWNMRANAGEPRCTGRPRESGATEAKEPSFGQRVAPR